MTSRVETRHRVSGGIEVKVYRDDDEHGEWVAESTAPTILARGSDALSALAAWGILFRTTWMTPP